MTENMEMGERRELLLNWVRFTVLSLVDYPSKAHVYYTIGEQTTIYFVEADTKDIGKVIGKYGKTAQAIRDLMVKMAANLDFRAIMEIKDYR